MFKLFLFIFFKCMNRPYEDIPKNYLSKFISNPELRNDIISKKKFLYLWRKKLNNEIIHEEDKIKKIHFSKKKDTIILKVRTIHSFRIKGNINYRKSLEILNYIFIVSNFKIKDMACEEYDADKYKKLLHTSSSCPKNSKNTCIWSDIIDDIDTIFENYTKQLIPKPDFKDYRSNNSYSKESAISYAKKYALTYNSYYLDFNDNGGDCTNFISQCLYAGNIPLTNTWKPYTNTWLRVNELYYYLTRNNIGETVQSLSLLSKGDIIQFFSNSKGFFAHSGIITDILDNGEILYSCHTYDKLDYPLSEIYPYLYTRLRLIKISY